jgi:hypothetical protein
MGMTTKEALKKVLAALALPPSQAGMDALRAAMTEAEQVLDTQGGDPLDELEERVTALVRRVTELDIDSDGAINNLEAKMLDGFAQLHARADRTDKSLAEHAGDIAAAGAHSQKLDALGADLLKRMERAGKILATEDIPF